MSMLESNWLRLVICYFKLSKIIKSLCCYPFESITNYCQCFYFIQAIFFILS
jgi:hypothetical protein